MKLVVRLRDKAVEMTMKTSPAKKTPAETPPFADKAALDLVMRMMAIPGRSGQERRIVEFISDQLRAAGAAADSLDTDNAHQKSVLRGEVGNLILRLPGAAGGPRRMLMAHLDTVPICVGCRPVLRKGMVHSADASTGLGGDDRAGSAVLLTTALGLLKSGAPHPPLVFAWMVQEEVGLHGARCLQLAKLGRPKLVFNFDGGSPAKLTIGATGGYRMAIEITGLASHAGGAPEKGVSAIVIAARAIADLDRSGWHGLVQKDGRAGTSNVGVIQGGEATNVVTDRVLIRAEARSHDPKFRARIVKEIEAAFRRAAREVRSVHGKRGAATFEGRLDYESYRLATDDPSVRAAEAAVRAAGAQPELAISNGGLDANWTTARGLPTVTLGCGQVNIHTTNEKLDVAEYQLARRIAWRLATEAD